MLTVRERAKKEMLDSLRQEVENLQVLVDSIQMYSNESETSDEEVEYTAACYIETREAIELLESQKTILAGRLLALAPSGRITENFSVSVIEPSSYPIYRKADLIELASKDTEFMEKLASCQSTAHRSGSVRVAHRKK